MGINISLLEKVKHRASYIVARCPACAEADRDRKGEHLFIHDSGRFGCVLYPGPDGHQHRKRIFELVGIKDTPVRSFKINKPACGSEPKPIQKDILGHLGHVKASPIRGP